MTIEEVFLFIDDTPIKTIDVLELKCRIASLVQAERAKAVDEVKKKFRIEFEEMMAIDMEDCINWADWLDGIAEQMKGGAI